MTIRFLISLTVSVVYITRDMTVASKTSEFQYYISVPRTDHNSMKYEICGLTTMNTMYTRSLEYSRTLQRDTNEVIRRLTDKVNELQRKNDELILKLANSEEARRDAYNGLSGVPMFSSV